MKEPYEEGLATHFDPESCACRGNAVGEALTGAGAGWVLSCETSIFPVPTISENTEGNIGRTASARCEPNRRSLRPHARSEPSCAEAGRSHVWPRNGAVVRAENP